MTIIPHWFLPTNGDSRSDLTLGNAVGGEGSRVLDADGNERNRETELPQHSAEVTTLRRPVLRSSREAVAVAERFAEQISVDAIERDRTGTLPAAEMAAFDASGLLGITVPRQHGGGDLPIGAMADVVRTIAAADSAIAQTPQGHFLMVDMIAIGGSDTLRARLLDEVVAGRRIASALAERGGKHAQDLKTRLRPTSAGPVRDGVKYYATGALTAHWIAVSALDEHDRMALAFVRRDAPGVSLTHDWNVMGQRATVSGSVSLESVTVDPEFVLPYSECFEVPQLLGARAQLYHAAIQVGLATGALEAARWFVSEKARPFFEATRAGWADTSAGDPHVIHRFGSLATQVRAAQTLLADAAAELDSIGRAPEDAEAAARGSIAVAQAKAFASDVAIAVSSDLFSMSGASVADEKYDLSRYWRNARTHVSHDPVDWKYHHVGNFLLSGVLPPNHGQL